MFEVGFNHSLDCYSFCRTRACAYDIYNELIKNTLFSIIYILLGRNKT